MIKKGWLLLPGLLALVTLSRAQDIGGNVVPGGSSGGVKAGNNLFNVDPYTGTGSANVSIYSYGIDNLGLGVSLSYNAKGVRVNDLSSSAGLGWTLNAHGIISREVRGIEDEVTLQTRFYSTLPNQFSYGYTNGCGAQTCFNQHDTLQGILVPDAMSPGEVLANPGGVYRLQVYDDIETDLFHFSLGSRSFSFAFKKTPNGLVYYTYPRTDVKIEVLTCDYNPATGQYNTTGTGIPYRSGADSLNNLITFVITDESGNKFYFKRGDYQIKEFDLDSLVFLPHKGIYYATQNWVIDKIVTFTGKEITYSYEKKYLEYLENISESFDYEQLLGDGDSIVQNPLKIKEQYWKGYKNHIAQINYPDGVKVKFDLDHSNTSRCDCQGDFRLKNIVVESTADENVGHSIRFRLDQAYFNTPKYSLQLNELPYSLCSMLELAYLSSGNGFNSQFLIERHKRRGLRLKLKSITKIGTDGSSSTPYYTFGYNDLPLPYRFGPGQDYYGYPNGDTAIPLMWVKYSDLNFPLVDSPYYLTIPHAEGRFWGADRSYNFTYAQSGVLNRITNPLGGKDSVIYTDYQLENPVCGYGDGVINNHPLCPIDDNGLEGTDVNDGLVVGKIISTDKSSVDLKSVTEYTYMSGQRFFIGGYTSYPYYNYGTVYTNAFVDPHNTVNGSNHGFDSIIVSTYGYNNERLSKSKYVYSNLMYEGVSAISKLSGLKYSSTDATMRKYRMGIPLRHETYDEWDNLVFREESFYETKSVGDSIFNRSIYSSLDPYHSVNGEILCWADRGYYDYLLLDHQWMQLTQGQVTRFIKGPGVSVPKTLVTNYYYTYDDSANITCIRWQDSKGETYKKYRKYNYNYYSSNPGHVALQLMQDRNMHFLLSSETWRMTGNDSVLLNYETLVPGFSGHQVPRLRFPASFTSNLKKPLTSAEAANTGHISRSGIMNYSSGSYGSDIEKSKEYTAYDYRDNVAEMAINDKEMYESYIWDTRTLEKMAEVKNARLDEIAYSSFENVYGGAGWKDGNLWLNTTYKVFAPGSTSLPPAMTGKYVFELKQTGCSDCYIESKALPANDYIISFWSYTPVSGANLSVERHNNGSNLGSITTTAINTVGNWKLNVGSFSAASSDFIRLKNNGTGGHSVFIDELRIYPVKATMTTTTYKPLFGPGSTCDANNYIQYIEYDVFGKPTIVRDMRGNILSKTETAKISTDPNTTGSSPNNPTY